MAALRNAEDRVHWFTRELEARVVAESGIPSDRFHLGKLILMSLKDAPDFVMQIDATTEESETYRSVLERSVKCATAFKKMGLKTGDNIVLLAPNHIHLAIPLYAGLYLGIGVAPVDAFLTVKELGPILKFIGPSVIFCQNERVAAVKEALENILIHSTVVTFNESNDCISFSDFIETHSHDVNDDTFSASDFDTGKTPAVLVCTSGTTGLPKAATLTHKNLVVSFPYLWRISTNFPTPTRLALICSSMQGLSAGFHFLVSPVIRYTRLQSSEGVTPENFVKIVKKYKPSYITVSPPLLAMLIKPENVAKCDISCFEDILIAGSNVSKELLASFRKVSPNTNLHSLYGSTEIIAPAFYDTNTNPPGPTGRPYGLYDYRLVDPETKKDITEPHVNGELWLRGPSVCNGYYNQPEATKEAFVEDGWFRTGDLFYRDENYFFFFVERLKLLLKYKNYQISPLELESVIRQHPGVLDVAVIGLPDQDLEELPVAFVTPKFGHIITAQEIKDIVKNNLTDSKQLRGGVVFMKELPMTASTKVNRRKLKELAKEVTRK